MQSFVPPAPVRRYVRAQDVALRPPAGLVQGAWGQGDLAIVVPVVAPDLTLDEAVSIATLRRFAPDETKIIIKPENLTICWDTAGFIVRSLPDAAMASLTAYNALMLSPWFYEAFAGFEYLIIFQLDCLLFGSNFRAFTRLGQSFIGAPYFRRNGQLKGIGNGGFSMRSTADALAVLRSRTLSLALSSTMLRQYLKPTYFRILWRGLTEALRNQGRQPLGYSFSQGYPRAEDEFWSYFAPLFSVDFRVPKARVGAAFAAESRPRDVVRLNDGKLPLGAHAWTLHDRAYWESILIDLGFEAEVNRARAGDGQKN